MLYFFRINLLWFWLLVNSILFMMTINIPSFFLYGKGRGAFSYDFCGGRVQARMSDFLGARDYSKSVSWENDRSIKVESNRTHNTNYGNVKVLPFKASQWINSHQELLFFILLSNNHWKDSSSSFPTTIRKKFYIDK